MWDELFVHLSTNFNSRLFFIRRDFSEAFFLH